MDFSTRIEIPASPLHIDHKSRIIMFGSCFIENIGDQLTRNKFEVNVNPFGILYNPASISQSLHMLIENKRLIDKDIFEHKGLYHSFYHHSRFSDIDKEQCLSNINKKLEEASNELRTADVLFITFGTAYVYKLKEQPLIVGNCHKLPASHFNRFRLETDEIVDSWNVLIKNLKQINPKLRIIFTVSPIRHLKDGAHENQLSKSTLLLAIDKICQSNTDILYFPSYEIVLDELRDYRFYNEDMVHPSAVAIKYIWERFRETYFSPTTCKIAKEWAKIAAALEHRSFNKESEDHKSFLRQTLLKVQTFKEKYPYICVEKETITLKVRLED